MNALFSAQRNGMNVKGATLYCTTYPCHNCCKHIISAGIREVVYLEPYRKSYASELHKHEITTSESDRANKVLFRAFLGVTHNRFEDLFSINYGSGTQIKRKSDEDNSTVPFSRKTKELRYQLNSKTIRGIGKVLSDALLRDNKFNRELYKAFIKPGKAG